MKSEKTVPFKRLLWLTPILFLALVFGVNSQALAGVDLEVPLEMASLGLKSGTAGRNFYRSRMYLDTNDYDNATYFFEIVARNANTTTDYGVILKDENVTTMATITVDANTTSAVRKRSTAFTPTTGKKIYYIKLPATAVNAELKVYTARIIVQQTNATKTRIQIPLVGDGYNTCGVKNDAVDTTTSITYTQGVPKLYSIWKKDSSAWGDIASVNPWTVEAVLTGSATGTAYAALYNTNGSAVTGAEVSYMGEDYFLAEANFGDSADNFTDGDTFEFKIKASSGTTAQLRSGGRLYVRLINLSRGEVYWRFAKKNGETPNGYTYFEYQRVLLNTNNYSNPEVYHESTGYESVSGDLIAYVADAGIGDSGASGSAITNSSIEFDLTRATQRATTDLMPDVISGNSYISSIYGTSGTIVVVSGWLVVKFSAGAACPTPGTPSVVNPGDLATGVPVTQALDWTDCTDTDTYEVYLDENPSPTTKVAEIPATQSTYDPDLGYCTHYYWKIVAKNDCGKSIVSDVWEFTTEDGPPEQPSNPDPADGAIDVSPTAHLTWSHVSGADSYDVYCGEASDPPYVGTTTDNSYNPILDFNTHYYWKIEAYNPCGYSTTGDIWEFTTGAGTSHYVDGDAGDDDLYAPYDSTDTPAKTIQAAINACASGTVYVKKATGTYTKINMKSNVHVVGTDATWGEPASRDDYPTADRTTRAAVRFLGPLYNSRLSYFKVTGGKMEEGLIYVSGVHGEINNDVIIEKCWLYNGSHAGINLRGAAAPTIRDCDIEDPRTSGISSFLYGIEPASTPMIIQGCDLSGSGAGWGLRSGIRLAGSGSSGIEVTIGGSGVGDGNTISNNGYTGIRLDDIGEVSIENNDISNNGRGGILLVDASTVSPHIKNNDIYNHVNAAGINIGGASTVTIGDNNNIYSNNTGIAFYTSNNSNIGLPKSSAPVTITGNNIYSNDYAGIAVRDGINGPVSITQNNIHLNKRSGIRMQRKCTLDITRNDIHDNLHGGIHTGSDVADGGGFAALQIGLGFLTIAKNKIHDNGQANMGGGIDVRHMPGTIYNNLIYRNRRGGIRFGDFITEIVHNTVVDNGWTGSGGGGGGIIFDDLAGAVNDPPAGVPPVLDIKNNICAHNIKAGIRACFDNTPGFEERDYNLLYANYPWNDVWSRDNPPDCGWPTPVIPNDYTCLKQKYGGCGVHIVSGVIVLDDPHDIIADPLFKDMSGDNYRLQNTSEGDDNDSPAIGAGEGGVDMGAYGGSDPLDW